MMGDYREKYVGNSNPLFAAGLIVRQNEPKNLEAPFHRIDSYLTPTKLLYVRRHFTSPNLDRASYHLQIDGAVGSPCALSYEELRSMRSETRVAGARSPVGTRGSQQCGMDRCATTSVA
jgi:hypothetical protein